MHWVQRIVMVGAALCATLTAVLPQWGYADDRLRLSTFSVDASPPIGSPLAYDPTKEVTEPLSCRGVVLLGTGEPIVLCAVDWIGIANDAQEIFRNQLAAAAGTVPDRVAIHTLHQHDAPRCDLGAAKLLAEAGHVEEHYDVPFITEVFARTAQAVKDSLASAKQIDGIAYGQAEIKDVASNRRMLDGDGKVVTTRYTACRDEAVRNLPVGVIDPLLRMITFYSGQTPIARLSFFATHPQSYYRTGGANPDFPGMARDAHEKATGVFHVHFNGAGGNIGAGKYNDGSHAMRKVLADRVLLGMQQATENQTRQPLQSGDIKWAFQPVSLPLADHMNEEALAQQVNGPTTAPADRVHAADKLSFLRRTQAGHKIAISCLELADTSVVFMPGELFVEYQLAAAAMRPDRHVCMAAYGDYGPFYIGTRVAYPQGGYETSPGASNVSPEVEEVLLAAMNDLLGATVSGVHASDFTDTMGPGLPPSPPTSN